MNYESILAAAARLDGVAHRTPIITSRALDAAAGTALLLKCENLQRGGAFKFRGAYNTIAQIPEQQRQRGVLAFSSGNHAQGVALAAQLLGVPAVICMPDDAPAVKVAATREYGAEMVFYNRQHDDREAFAQRVAAERGLPIVPPYDHANIIAGAGTAALELMQDAPDLDALVVPVGGGGLISGSLLAAHGLRPDLPVYGVEPEDGDDALQSLRAGQRECVPPPRTIADGLRTQALGALTFPIIQRHVADIVTVSDDEIRAALRFVLLRLKLVIEPSGAVGIAAALGGKIPGNPRRIGIIVSGGNIDPDMLATLWQ